jgi:hypothetical protein
MPLKTGIHKCTFNLIRFEYNDLSHKIWVHVITYVRRLYVTFTGSVFICCTVSILCNQHRLLLPTRRLLSTQLSEDNCKVPMVTCSGQAYC